jgi:hypothetical protein
MRAMNAIRRFLLRGGLRSQVILLAASALLLVRALLPGGVMLDPVSAAEGDFALVICSGHGPMFAHDHGPMAAMSDAMPGMDMSHMADTPGMSHDGKDMPGMSGMSGNTAHDTMTADDGLCPFSAALVIACVGIALAFVLFELTRVTGSWLAVPVRTPARASPHFLPLSRAPPLFS